MTNADPSEPHVDPPRSDEPAVTRVKTPYRERLRSPCNINTFRSISILVVQSVIMFGITLLLAFTLPLSPESRALTTLILVAVTLGLAHTLVRARKAAYVVVTVAIVGSAYPVLVLMRPQNDEWAAFGVVVWLIWGGIAMIIAAVVEWIHSPPPHWEPWRSYATVALLITVARAGSSSFLSNRPNVGLVLWSIVVSAAIGVALLFVLRQLCAVLEGLGIYGTPYVPIGLIRRPTKPTIEG